MNKTRTSEGRLLQVIFTAVTLLFALLCIVPYILVVIGSFTDESVLTTDGLGFFPTKWSSNAYQVLFASWSL